MPVVANARLLRRVEAKFGSSLFDEAKHPRSKGKFAKKAGGAARVMGHEQGSTPQSAVPASEAARHRQMGDGAATDGGDPAAQALLKRLQSTAGTDQYDSVHAQLQQMSLPQVKFIAKSMVGVSSGSKSDNIKRIRVIHQTHRVNARKMGFVGGRSAA